MKRKDLKDVNEDFSEFSLSSPARKIRRLVAELPPIIEDELEMPMHFEHPSSQTGASVGLQAQLNEPVIEELSSLPENEERAIVLFKPPNTLYLDYPHNFFVDSELISTVKIRYSDQAVWGINRTRNQSVEDKDSKADMDLAVVPWVPSQHLHQQFNTEASQSEESMEFEEMEMEHSTMDCEDIAALRNDQLQQANEYSKMSDEGTQQYWQQQQHHCLIPDFPRNMTTPIVWN